MPVKNRHICSSPPGSSPVSLAFFCGEIIKSVILRQLINNLDPVNADATDPQIPALAFLPTPPPALYFGCRGWDGLIQFDPQPRKAIVILCGKAGKRKKNIPHI